MGVFFLVGEGGWARLEGHLHWRKMIKLTNLSKLHLVNKEAVQSYMHFTK